MVLVKFVLDVKNGLAISLKELAIILEPKKRIGNKTIQVSVLVIVLKQEKSQKAPHFFSSFFELETTRQIVSLKIRNNCTENQNHD